MMKKAVITGVGVASPLGVGWSQWAAGLKAGKPGIRRIQAFDPAAPFAHHLREGYEGRPLEPLSCQVAGEIPDFVPQEHFSAKDLSRVPRVVPVAVCAAREALQSAGYGDATQEHKRNIGVMIGSGGGGFSFAEEQFSHWFGATRGMLSPYAVSSTVAGALSSEISITFGLRGRSHTVSDGCTSSSDALGYALDLIRNGRSRTLLVGGADAPITPGTLAAFGLMRAVPMHFNECPERACRPFDRDRDGFVLGEGAWMFVLEEYEHAKARGAHIWAEVAGYGATCEAYHRVQLGEPDEAARAMRLALDDADVAPEQVDHANLHGTSTPLNDPLETAAIKLALGARATQIPHSATKSQIGHPQGASGAAGVASALLALNEGVIAPTLNLDNPAEGCDLDYTAQHAGQANVEVALCNCLGFGSKNAALVLKRAA